MACATNYLLSTARIASYLQLRCSSTANVFRWCLPVPDRSVEYDRGWAQYFQPKSPEELSAIKARYFGKIAQVDTAIGDILAAYDRKGWLENTAVIFTSE